MEAERRREVQSTVAEVARPMATIWPTVASTAALGARRLGWLSSSPNTLKVPVQHSASAHFMSYTSALGLELNPEPCTVRKYCILCTPIEGMMKFSSRCGCVLGSSRKKTSENSLVRCEALPCAVLRNRCSIVDSMQGLCTDFS